jgi:hypothetical protein
MYSWFDIYQTRIFSMIMILYYYMHSSIIIIITERYFEIPLELAKARLLQWQCYYLAPILKIA